MTQRTSEKFTVKGKLDKVKMNRLITQNIENSSLPTNYSGSYQYEYNFDSIREYDVQRLI